MKSPGPADPASNHRTNPGGGLVIVGLTGGIGAGKSTIAREFARLGWKVIDSDAESRAALKSPDIVARIVEWWGPSVLNGAGEVDRSALGKIVFADPVQRERLESLIHPRIAERRAEIVEAARSVGGPRVPGVVYDAPLLLEAGLDKECDAVIFVDSSLQTRLDRVRASRGWNEVELARREAAQWPLSRKRRASHHVIQNDGPSADAAAQVHRIAAILVGTSA